MKRNAVDQTPDPTDDLISLTLCNLAETGVPEAVYFFRCWMDGVEPHLSLLPDRFTDPEDFMVAYQAANLLRKFPFGGSSNAASRKARALESFMGSEATCRSTSTRLEADLFLGHNLGRPERELIARARDFCHRVLGDFSWDAALSHCDFGPGASVGVKRRDGHSIKKIGHKRPTVTGTCLPLLLAYRQWDPNSGLSSLDNIEIVSGSKWATVPKDRTTDRTICLEPLWNMFFQKGIGGLIRARLRKRGLDLDTQAYRNRAMSKRGSEMDTHATLDLSAASDTVTLRLVEYLVPESWYEAICLTRSPSVDVDGRQVLLSKVSSMGNGFTFELESLIFLALAWVCCPKNERRVGVDVMTFGDDIIVPGHAAQATSDLLVYAGFTVNMEKSYLSGPFRESCGGNFFTGHNVTPIRMRKRMNHVTHLYWFYNQIRRQYNELVTTLIVRPHLTEVAQYIEGLIPRRLRCRIPDNVGDVGLVTSWDEARPSCRRGDGGVEGFVFRTFSRTVRKPVELDGPGALWRFHWTRYCKPGSDVEYLRNCEPLTRFAFTWGFSRHWPHMAPIVA